MARKGQQTRQKRLFRSAQRFHLVPEKIDHHVVGIAPFRSRGIELHILLPDQLLPAGRIHERSLVGEVQVAAVHEYRTITFPAERTGQRRQRGAFSRQLHDRHGRLGRKSAQDGHLSPVGTERIGEEVFEPDTLPLETLHVGHHRLAVHRFVHDRSAEALQQDQYDVRPVAAQQSGRTGIGPGTVAPQLFEKSLPPLLFEERISLGIVLIVPDRREKRKNGVRRSVVQEHVRAEIDLADIRRGDRHTAPDRQKSQAADQQRRNRRDDPAPQGNGFDPEKP